MDRKASIASPAKNMKKPKPVTATMSATLRKIVPTKEKPNTRTRCNNTSIGACDITLCKNAIPNFDAEYREIAYGKFLRAMLEDCLVDEKINREETQIDLQMSQLADRFDKTRDLLDKTNKRLKDISFVVEQKRLIDLKNKDSASFYDIIEESQVKNSLDSLSTAEEVKLDLLETSNIDFGYTKESGHKQLLDAVNDALEGLEEIKKHSVLDIGNLTEYEKTQKTLEVLEKDQRDLEDMKTEFERRLPKCSEKILIEVSETLSNMINNDEDNSVAAPI